MDIVSDVITSLRSGEPEAARVRWRAPWGFTFPAEPGTVGFFVILQGACWLRPPSGEAVHLGVGDVLFCPHGDGFSVADSPATPLVDARGAGYGVVHEPVVIGGPGTGRRPVWQPHPAGPQPATEPVDVPATTTLCGGYRLRPGHEHPLLRELPAVIRLPAHAGRHAELRAAIETLSAEIDTPRLGSAAVTSVLLDLLLLYMLRAQLEPRPERGERTGWAAALADPAIRAALDAIHDDPTRPWTVQTLADHARLSRAGFSRRFATLTGMPPLTYLTWWRLTTAARALTESDRPVHQIARQAGYTSEFAFAAAFKRHHAVPPSVYRRQRAG